MRPSLRGLRPLPVLACLAVAGSAAPAGAASSDALTSGRPVDCGTTRSGTYRMHAGPRTSCRFARATYEAFVRDLDAGRVLVAAVDARYALRVRNPSTGRLVRLDVHALARAHGELEFTFVRRSAAKSLAFENLTSP